MIMKDLSCLATELQLFFEFWGNFKAIFFSFWGELLLIHLVFCNGVLELCF